MQMSINVCVFWMFINHMKHDSGFECAFYGEGLTTGQLGSQLVNLAHNWSTGLTTGQLGSQLVNLVL